MKRTWKKLSAFVCAFTLVAAPATFNGDSMWSGADGAIVSAAENSTDYTITIPATLSVANAGWNATDGITAKVKSGDTFDTSKKLTVTAESANSWALKSGANSIGYNLVTAEGTYSAIATPASWEFSAGELNAENGTNKAMGINVQNYSEKPAGNYQDTVTFTAKVESAVTLQTFNSADVTAGTILHIGDKIEVGSTMLDFYGWSLPANNTYTLVRVNATQGEMPWDLDITESDAGAYYAFKGIENGSTKYRPSSCEDMPKATNTSDGVIVKEIGEFAPELCVHEP